MPEEKIKIENPKDFGYSKQLNTPQTVDADAEQRKQRENELVKSFFTLKEPAPVIDTAKLDRLQRMGKINALGKGISVLGDALATGIGANVQRRNPDTTSPALFQAYQNTLDKYKDEKTAHDNRNYQTERQNILFGLQRLDKESAEEFRNRVQAAREQAAKDKLEADNLKYLNDYGLKEAAHNLNVDKANSANKNNQAKNAIAFEKNDIAREKLEATKNKPFMIAQVDGKETPLMQGEFRALLAQAAKDTSFKDFKASMDGFENNPLEVQKNIVQRYLSHLDKQKKEKESDRVAAPIPQQKKKTTPNKTFKLEKGSLDNL